MRKLKISMIVFFALTFLTNCNNDEKIKGLKSNEILVVTLDIEDNIDLKQVILISTGGTDKISGTQIENKRKLKLKTPQRGEGTFSICVYTATDTLCSQDNYIEGGYRPKLKLRNNKFEMTKWF